MMQKISPVSEFPFSIIFLLFFQAPLSNLGIQLHRQGNQCMRRVLKPESGDEGHWKRDKWFSRKINKERSMPPSRLNQTPGGCERNIRRRTDGRRLAFVCIRERERGFNISLGRQRGECGSFVLNVMLINRLKRNELQWFKPNWENREKFVIW